MYNVRKIIALCFVVAVMFSLTSLQTANAGQWNYFQNYYPANNMNQMNEAIEQTLYDPWTWEELCTWSYCIYEDCIYAFPEDEGNGWEDLEIMNISNSYVYALTNDYTDLNMNVSSAFENTIEMGYEWEGPGTAPGVCIAFNYGFQGGGFSPYEEHRIIQPNESFSFPSYPVHNLAAERLYDPVSVCVLIDSIPFAIVPSEQFLDAGYSQSFLTLNSDTGYPTGYYYGDDTPNTWYDDIEYIPWWIYWYYGGVPMGQLWSYQWDYYVETVETGVYTDPGESLISLQLKAYTETWAYSQDPLVEYQMIYGENSNYTWAWGSITGLYPY
ncbi:MAG: hypothetical protein JW787_17405 [Sedimentisphaerales bacterium]|nr:hypothetical protein [Sedimentisphaerales bacterium]